MELANSIGAMAETDSRSLSYPVSKKRYLDSYTIIGTNKVVRQVGESVIIRPLGNEKDPYVARVQRFVADAMGNVRVIVRWFYRPEEASTGRLTFHGMNADTIDDKCIVHTYKNYANIEDVGPEDYFCRCEYEHATGRFSNLLMMV
ncbi:bromo adjacent homology (BAH) domain, Zinc finger, RING/FYVE/PHD-type [Artemisia annua]|uniref:Bromo adjacent homology (BAH) domain, Zinc finger, RING/FYVE/PHD-type n=1 Tax=Artemisia annua TaxID=35608 RepID=A0A2U1MH77_ARTAN|nr:bromo adjacent homology (BAH) domain, Zinc finger, RING/FYVE/PHD-type [Artemisia annua]